MQLPEKLVNAINQFCRIPGIGEKTALRQSLLLAKWDREEIEDFGESMKLLAELKRCAECGMLTERNICQVCEDPVRQHKKTLCVVETVSDCLAIEKSEQFNGIYFILGGVLNPLLGIGPAQLNIHKLVEKVEKNSIYEVLLALNPSVEGDVTSSYIKQVLPKKANIARIGLGLPVGSNLEYLDRLTISRALENKRML
ncbi:MAG: recombination mediator RecR [Halobacteriovoraceae bacterium]|nr:recombination mediator RecR [Halobacteriovoraceae bacterium]